MSTLWDRTEGEVFYLTFSFVLCVVQMSIVAIVCLTVYN